MKNRVLYTIIALVAAGCALLSLFATSGSGVVSSVMAFPFEQIAAALHWLAGIGRIGNAFSLLILAALGAIALIPALRRWGDKERRGENFTLILLALSVWLVIYLLADSSALLSISPVKETEILPMLHGIIGGVAWSAIVAWITARLLRLFKSGDMEKLLTYMRMMLRVLCCLFAAAAMLEAPGELMRAVGERQSAADGVFAVLRFAVHVLPFALDIAVTILAMSFLDEMIADRHGEAGAAAAERLSRLCCVSLLAMSLSTVGLNLLQLLFMNMLSDVNVSVEVPVISLAFVLAVLMVARLVRENKRLADDNDLFI